MSHTALHVSICFAKFHEKFLYKTVQLCSGASAVPRLEKLPSGLCDTNCLTCFDLSIPCIVPMLLCSCVHYGDIYLTPYSCTLASACSEWVHIYRVRRQAILIVSNACRKRAVEAYLLTTEHSAMAGSEYPLLCAQATGDFTWSPIFTAELL